MIFVDNFTKMMWVEFPKNKYKAFEKFKIFKNRVENESGVKVKCLRSDIGGEFTSREFNIFCEDNGIQRKLSLPRRLEKNGIAKRRNKFVVGIGRAILFEMLFENMFLRHFGEKQSIQ